jgi:hypothetical protein
MIEWMLAADLDELGPGTLTLDVAHNSSFAWGIGSWRTAIAP